MKPAKYSKKYAKIQTKAELCTSREEALEILNKAEKLQKKTRALTPVYKCGPKLRRSGRLKFSRKRG